MSWLENPRYVRARDKVIDYLRSDSYRFRGLLPVVFLCGGAGSISRDTLRDYLLHNKSNLNVNIFYAERVWNLIASRTDHSALEMESELADLADLVIIIVESPGTFAELGAFSLNDSLRQKILPIVDSIHSIEQSFIGTGPLKWIDADSKFAPTVYVSLLRILESIDQIEERIKRIRKPSTIKISDLSTSPKHLLFFLCDLIAVIYPATIEMIEHYLGQIAPSILSSKISVGTLVALAAAMDLLRSTEIKAAGGKETYFSPTMSYELEHPYHGLKLNLPSQRAAHVSVLLTVPEAKAVLDELGKMQ
jgi:hypothetical protein